MSCLDVIAGRKYNEYIYVLGFELSNYDYVSKYTDSILLNFILIESFGKNTNKQPINQVIGKQL